MESLNFRDLKETATEMYEVARANMSTVWFWIPVLFALYIPFQLYLMFINPLLLAIVPLILSACLVYQDEKGFRARYQLGKTGAEKTAGEPVFWDIERYIQKSRDKKLKK